MERIPVSEQDPKERAKNFKEVCLGYNEEEAKKEHRKKRFQIRQARRQIRRPLRG